jgi:hypothetical protein
LLPVSAYHHNRNPLGFFGGALDLGEPSVGDEACAALAFNGPVGHFDVVTTVASLPELARD